MATAQHQPAQTAGQFEAAQDIDELGALEQELAPIRPKLARVEVLRARIRGRYDFELALKTFEPVGARYGAMIGARGNQPVFNVAKLVKAIGAKAFHGFATCTLKAFEAHVAPDVVKAVVTTEATGPRSLKTYARTPAA